MQIRCCISIKGQLDLSWQEWFETLDVLPEASGKTVLRGSLPDQAALYRVLLKIRSLGLVLLSLETDELPLNQEGESEGCCHQGQVNDEI